MDSILEASEETRGEGKDDGGNGDFFWFVIKPEKKKNRHEPRQFIVTDKNQFGWREQRRSHMDGIMSGCLDGPLTGAADRKKRWK